VRGIEERRCMRRMGRERGGERIGRIFRYQGNV
jgi:hypothetical protein